MDNLSNFKTFARVMTVRMRVKEIIQIATGVADNEAFDAAETLLLELEDEGLIDLSTTTQGEKTNG